MLDADDDAMRTLLERTRTIAVVGLKDGAHEDSWRVSRYLQQNGYRIVPINPKLGRCLDEQAFASLSERAAARTRSGRGTLCARGIDGAVDLVDVFRASAHVGSRRRPRVFTGRPAWLQLGVRERRRRGFVKPASSSFKIAA